MWSLGVELPSRRCPRKRSIILSKFNKALEYPAQTNSGALPFSRCTFQLLRILFLKYISVVMPASEF